MKLTKLNKLYVTLILTLILIITSIPVSADFGPYEFSYVAQDSIGIIYLTTDPCAFYPINDSNRTSSKCTFMVTRPETSSDMIILYPSSVNGVISYDIRYISINNSTDNNSILYYSTADGLVHYENIRNSSYNNFYIYGDNRIYSLQLANISIQFDSLYAESTELYKIKANYQPLLKTSKGTPTKYGIPSSNVTVDESITLESLLGGGNEDIINTVNNIITVIQQNHNDIMNAGSGYPLPDNGDELASAESSLSAAEDAISDKSQSIKDQISSQVQSNLELAASSVDKVKQDSVQIKQLYATVTSSLPDEVKLLFVVVPLLLFVGWLIGRVRQ